MGLFDSSWRKNNNYWFQSRPLSCVSTAHPDVAVADETKYETGQNILLHTKEEPDQNKTQAAEVLTGCNLERKNASKTNRCSAQKNMNQTRPNQIKPKAAELLMGCSLERKNASKTRQKTKSAHLCSRALT